MYDSFEVSKVLIIAPLRVARNTWSDEIEKWDHLKGLMKKSLSGNTWGGSTWDGVSVYTKKTQEQNADGSYVTITADFRRYSCGEDSIADHSAYLLGAKNGSKFRYDGLKGCTDYKKAAQIIKAGGYATSLTYVDKLCSIIERWKLTQYDVAGESSDVVKYYRVRKSWDDAKSQLGLIRFLLMQRLWLIRILDMRFMTGTACRFILRWQKVLQVG